jgi:hypothetical protein
LSQIEPMEEIGVELIEGAVNQPITKDKENLEL